MDLYAYDAWPSVEPYDWSPATRENEYDQLDFHVDLGCGRLKRGRIGVDRHPDPGVNVVCDLDGAVVGNDGLVHRVPITRFVPTAPGQNAEAPAGNTPFGWAVGLPFADSSIKSIISYHALEHIGEGFIHLIDEVYRVLEPGGILRAITPLFPSRTAVEDPDHKRQFMVGTWQSFCGFPDNHWHESFSTPYTKARFEMLHEDHSGVEEGTTEWSQTAGARELRVALQAVK